MALYRYNFFQKFYVGGNAYSMAVNTFRREVTYPRNIRFIFFMLELSFFIKENGVIFRVDNYFTCTPIDDQKIPFRYLNGNSFKTYDGRDIQGLCHYSRMRRSASHIGNKTLNPVDIQLGRIRR